MSKSSSSTNKKKKNVVEKKETKSSSKKNTNKSVNNVNKKDKQFEMTTKIRIDRDRLNDTGTLDTSFLEGKKSSNKKKILIAEEQMKKEEELNEERDNKGGFFKDFILVLLCLGTLILSFLTVDKYAANNKNECGVEKVKTKTETLEVDKYVVDDNYLFLGDYLTDEYDLDKYFEDKFVVKSAEKDDKIDDFSNKLYDLVYQFNPSKVFIEVGMNDLLNQETEEIVLKIKSLVEKIKENRSYCEIYVESLYPVNRDKDEDIFEEAVEKIQEVNADLLKMTKEQKVTYIDLYDLLADEDGNLKDEYSDDGKHLTDDGYDTISEEIKKYID